MRKQQGVMVNFNNKTFYTIYKNKTILNLIVNSQSKGLSTPYEKTAILERFGAEKSVGGLVDNFSNHHKFSVVANFDKPPTLSNLLLWLCQARQWQSQPCKIQFHCSAVSIFIQPDIVFLNLDQRAGQVVIEHHGRNGLAFFFYTTTLFAVTGVFEGFRFTKDCISTKNINQNINKTITERWENRTNFSGYDYALSKCEELSRH